MIVVAHGDVEDYCARHGMVIGSVYKGKLEDYQGQGLVVVTDNCADKNEFYYMKLLFMRRKITLLSTHWEDQDISDFVQYIRSREDKRGIGGRLAFGFTRNGLTPEGKKIAQRIFELRDAGVKYSEIQNDPGVRHLDGRKMSISTIQVILKNRGKYE